MKTLPVFGKLALSFLIISALMLASCSDDESDFKVAAPGTVTATAGDGMVTIDFTQVVGAVSYNLYWDTAAGVAIDTATLISDVTTPYEHLDLTNGTTYYYAMTAINAEGESALSAEASATPVSAGSASTPPSAPTGLAAAPDDTQVTLSWDAVSGADSYDLYWDNVTGVSSADNLVSNVSSPYDHTGLPNGTTYYYVVTASNAYGTSADSSEVSATPDPPPPPAAPTGLTVTPGPEQLTITWTDSAGATSYDLYWALSTVSSGTGTLIPNVSSGYVHTGLNPPDTYFYVVTASNAGGTSGDSTPANGQPQPPPPPPPTGLNATPSTGGFVMFAWSPPGGPPPSSYTIYWSTSSGMGVTGTPITFVTTGVNLDFSSSIGIPIFAVVVGDGGGGESAPSNEVNFTPIL